MKRLFRSKCKTLVHETPSIYKTFGAFIDSERVKKKWIFEVIDGHREVDRVIYQDEEISIVKDNERFSNWLAIFKDKELRSIRSLDGTHIPLLQRALTTIKEKMHKEKYMVYFHYPPSVWQLHLHVAPLCDGLRTTYTMQKVVFIDDVISHLTIDSDFYKKATISYVIPEDHDIAHDIKTMETHVLQHGCDGHRRESM